MTKTIQPTSPFLGQGQELILMGGAGSPICGVIMVVAQRFPHRSRPFARLLLSYACYILYIFDDHQ